MLPDRRDMDDQKQDAADNQECQQLARGVLGELFEFSGLGVFQTTAPPDSLASSAWNLLFTQSTHSDNYTQ